MAATREKRRLRRTQFLLAATSVALAAALTAGTVAVIQRGHADTRADEARRSSQKADEAAADAKAARVDAELRRVAVEAAAIATEQPDLGLLLAVEAARRRPGPESDSALLTALTAAPEIDRVIDVGVPESYPIRHTVIAQRGPLLVVTPTTAIVVDRNSLQPTGITWDVGPATTIVINGDGTEAATATSDRTLVRRSVASGDAIGAARRVVPVARYGRSNALAYINDGSLLVGNGSTIDVYRKGTEAPSTTIKLEGRVGTLISLDDQRVLASMLPEATGRTVLVDLAAGTTEDIGPGLVEGFVDRGHLVGITSASPNTAIAIDLATRSQTASSAPFLEFAYEAFSGPNGTVVVRTLGDEFILLDASDLSEQSRFRSQAQLAGPGPDGLILGALGSRLAVFDVTRLPLIAARLDITGPVFPPITHGTVIAGIRGASYLVDLRASHDVTPLPVTGIVAAAPDLSTVVVQSGTDLWLHKIGSATPAAGPVPASQLVEYSPDGTSLATYRSDRVAVYEVPSLTQRLSVDLTGNYATQLKWSDDSRWLMLTDLSAGQRIVDATTGDWKQTVGYFGTFLGDGRLLAGGAYEAMRFVKPATGEVVGTLVSTRDVGVLTTVPGDQLVIRRNTRGLVELFGLGFGRRLGDGFSLGLDWFPLAGASMTVAEDGSFALVGPPGQPVLRLEPNRKRWIELACEAAGRDLTEQEWATYLGEVAEYAPTCPS